ncbi:TraR/DksA family transcriptional regulator [Candidatus Wolfebacteria bacterium]|nr:TraR/DksA family transcriptional regulator [Candidatus Wolfebacteria bacterium]
MDIKILLQFKNQLIKTGNILKEKIKELSKVPEFGEDVSADDEESNETEEFGNQLSVAQNYKEQLAEIDNALKKIESKEYGICEKCGEEISLDVLEVAPESRLCKKCKKLS